MRFAHLFYFGDVFYCKRYFFISRNYIILFKYDSISFKVNIMTLIYTSRCGKGTDF